MCGRGACTLSAERCSRIAGGARVRNAHRLRPRYNLGPQGFVPVVTRAAHGSKGGSAGPHAGERGDLEVCAMKWSLVPSFAKRPEDYDVFKGGSSTFNARVEGLEGSGLWRRLLDTHRGVVLLDGFYEWKSAGKGKVPMFFRHHDNYLGHTIHVADVPAGAAAEAATQSPVLPMASATQEAPGSAPGAAAAQGGDGPRHAPLMIAALFDTWRPDKGAVEGPDSPEPLETVTIVTMDSVGTPISAVHDRMPVFLTPETAAEWLDSSAPYPKVIGPVLKSAAALAKELLMYEVAPLVSNVKNESPDCIMPKKEHDAKQFSRGLGKFFSKKADATPAPSATAAPAPAPSGAPPPSPEKRPLQGPGSSEAGGGGASSEQERPTKVARTDGEAAAPGVIDLDD